MQEIDEDAPIQWTEMLQSNSPEEYYERLEADERKIVDDWTNRRSILVQSMMSKSIEDSLKDYSSTKRTSKPYVKVLVKSLSRLSKALNNLDSDEHIQQTMSAELTVWGVTEEQLHLIKEGSVVRMKNLGVKSDRDGVLQLSAKTDTPMEQIRDEISQYQLLQSGYAERFPVSIIRVNLMAKKLDPDRLAREVDVVACIIKIERKDDNTSIAYLTDETGFVMKLTRNHNSLNKDPFHLGIEASLPTIVAFRNIQVSSFDTNEQCAKCSWNLPSCKTRTVLPRQVELHEWCNSSFGLTQCRVVLDRIIAKTPICAGLFNRSVCIGFILGFQAQHSSIELNHTSVYIDYGDDIPLVATIPFHVLCDTFCLTQGDAETGAIDSSVLEMGNLFDHATLPSTLIAMGEYFRDNQTLFHISLCAASSYGNGKESPLYEVTKVAIAATDSVSRLLLH